MNSFFVYWYDLLKRRRRSFFVILAMALAAIGWLAVSIDLTGDISKVLPRNEKVDRYLEVVNRSAFADELVLLIGPSAPGAPASTPGEMIAYASGLADSIRARMMPDYVSALRERADQEALRGVYRDILGNLPIFLEDDDYRRLDSLTGGQEIASAVDAAYKNLTSPMGFMTREFILADPVGLAGGIMKKLSAFNLDDSYRIIDGYVFSHDGKYLLMFLSPAGKSTDTKKNAILLEFIDKVSEDVAVRSGVGLDTQYFGSPAISVANANQLQRDIMLTMSLAIVLLVLFIGSYFGRYRVIPAIMLVTLMSAGLSIAVLKLAGREVSAISLGFGAVLLGIAIAYTIHYLNHLRDLRNPRQVIREITLPLVMSAVISSGDFFTLLLVRSEAVHDLGLFAGLSILAAGLLTLLVLPHITREIDWERAKENVVNRTVRRIASYPAWQLRWLPPVIIALTLVLFFFSRKVSFESDMTSMSYMTTGLKQAEATLDSISQYSLRSVYVVSSGKNTDEALKNARDFAEKADSLRKSGLVRKFTTVTGLALPREIQQERIDRWNRYWSEGKKEALIENLRNEAVKSGFRENVFEDFEEWLGKKFQPLAPGGMESLNSAILSPYLSENDGMTTVTTILKVRQEDKPALYDAIGEMHSSFVFDKQYLTSAFMEILNEDFGKLVMVSLLIVFLVLLVSYGRIELTLITFIPMLISWIWTLGLMGLFGIQLNIFNIIITSFVFGLGIDYALFSIQGMLQQYKNGTGDVDAYRSSVLMDAITTLIGLGVLILAVHPALRAMAVAAMIGIISVWFITWSLEPLLFRWLVNVKDRKRPAPVTFVDFLFAIFSLTIFATGSILLMLYGLLVFKVFRVKTGFWKDLFHLGLMTSSRFLIYANFLSPKVLVNFSPKDLKKPAVLIANHQSHIDIALMLMLHPRLLELTNDRVQSSRFYGPLVRMAEFFAVSEGMESLLPKMKKNLEQGYSILIFPEGTRSPDGRVQRFHKGAFLMAQELNADILPVIIHGSGQVYPKGEYFLRVGKGTIRFLPRIHPDDQRFGTELLEKSRNIRRYMAEEYEKTAREAETPAYFREVLIKNYIYKGPVLEWYLKVKIRLEKNYELFHRHLPVSGQITDIGCGYGFMSYMMMFLSRHRRVTGIDYDEEKIATARNCAAKNDRIDFIHGDVVEMELEPSRAFILADVLHYFPEEDQERLILKCISKLEDDGVLMIRDGDRQMGRKHSGTRLSEFFSTRIGFNRTRDGEHRLFFTSREKITTLLISQGLEVEVIDDTKLTSNLVYVARKSITKPSL